MQGLKKFDQSRRLCGIQVLAIGRHISTALDDLPN
jgi:hypothetical protein